jgi:DNA-directed RNA polymerase subunit F
MSKESPKRRRFIIRLKRKRKAKIKKLKEKLLKASDPQEKEKIINKILKISPSYPIQNLLNK